MGLISNGTTIFDAGALSAGLGFSMTFIKKLTASSSANLSFVHGASGVVLDSTYKEYLFTYNNIHPQTNNAQFNINFSADSGSNYNVQKTNTIFLSQHGESTETSVGIFYKDTLDIANGTGNLMINVDSGSDNDQSTSGHITVFNPSSTTFVKHFISNNNYSQSGDYSIQSFVGGYGNTTSAINAVQFNMSTGNIDAGDICLYGIS
jgi:hypothetical protein|tara:strand:- start:45 stop:662 length:618 start_codon:yes stop_codon:yes gene_type:complete